MKRRTLLADAGCVWPMAGINVVRLGILSYKKLPRIRAFHILLSAVVFCAFGLMFFKMSLKHTRRIKGYPEEFRPVWHFFDLNAYIIMAIMMGGGIWLRASCLGSCSRWSSAKNKTGNGERRREKFLRFFCSSIAMGMPSRAPGAGGLVRGKRGNLTALRVLCPLFPEAACSCNPFRSRPAVR